MVLPLDARVLIEATSDLHAGRIDRETWAARIAARKPYRLMPKEREDAEGHQRSTPRVPVLAVASGRSTEEDLHNAGAAHVLPDLTDTSTVLAHLSPELRIS
ncbi:hypothetical protein [Actinacidiphila glaucinigra]